MKNNRRRTTGTVGAALVLSLTLLLAAPAAGQASVFPVDDTLLTDAGWQAFGENLSMALRSDNEGCHVGALQQIIRYGDHLSMDRESVFDVMRLYRDHRDERVRRMAVLALGKMHDRWAIEFLDMASHYEQSECVRKTMEEVVHAYRKARKTGPVA